MKILHQVSAQNISWVKSNKKQLEANSYIENLYYPENITELKELLTSVEDRDIIGYSSNTLFLPSYKAKNVICTKHVNQWKETPDSIICDCGVSISKLSKYAIEQGYVGFEGLTDLPGTIAAAVYGNCGCRDCSVNDLVKSVTILDTTGAIKDYTVKELAPTYRNTKLKSGDIQGVILYVTLNKIFGNAGVLKEIAYKNHEIRKLQQPSGANNLGTTFIGGFKPTKKGKILNLTEKIIQKIIRTHDTRKSYPILLRLIGNGRFVPYIYYWNRYMFLDAQSHIIFPEYIKFIKSLYCDVQLEIEIKR